MVNVNLGLMSILIIIGLIALITVFPTNICLPFSDICFWLAGLHALKKILAYGGAVFFFYAYWVAVIYLFGRFLFLLVKYPFVKNGLAFLVTFSDENWQKFRASIVSDRKRS
jgi:hypothetical protein